MEIVKNVDTREKFENLEEGAVFTWEHSSFHFMKMQRIESVDEGDFNAVCIEDGDVTEFCDHEMVNRVNGKFIIE